VGADGAPARVWLQEQGREAHEAKDALVVERWLARAAPRAVEQRRDAAVAVGWACVGDGADLGQDGFVFGAAVGAAPGPVWLTGGWEGGVGGELLDQVGP
jgi:hypothetical protein